MREGARALWDSLHVTAKRAVLEALGMRVIIHRRTNRRAGFDPDTVEIRWDQGK